MSGANGLRSIFFFIFFYNNALSSFKNIGSREDLEGNIAPYFGLLPFKIEKYINTSWNIVKPASASIFEIQNNEK